MNSYQEYLKTDHWQNKRQEALEFYGHSCCLCGDDTMLRVHHRNYENLWHEDCAKDLIVLCADCHSKFHSNEEYPQSELSLLEYFGLALTAAWDHEQN